MNLVYCNVRDNLLSGKFVRTMPICLGFSHGRSPRAGELPLEIVRLKATGVIYDEGLDDNQGFTLPTNIGELGDDITSLNLSDCSLSAGKRVAQDVWFDLLC